MSKCLKNALNYMCTPCLHCAIDGLLSTEYRLDRQPRQDHYSIILDNDRSHIMRLLLVDIARRDDTSKKLLVVATIAMAGGRLIRHGQTGQRKHSRRLTGRRFLLNKAKKREREKEKSRTIQAPMG